MSVGTLLAWFIATYYEYKVKRDAFKFSLAQASLYMVIVCTLGIFVVQIVIDSLGREGVLCERTAAGELYLRASSNPNLQINALGGFYYFFITATLIWLSFAFLNILIIILLSIRFTHELKRDLTVFLVEFVVAFGVPLISVSIVFLTDPQSPFIGYYQILHVSIREPLTLLFLDGLVYSIAVAAILTIVIIVITKLRLHSVRSASLTGRKLVLSEMEKRLLAYSSIFSFILIIASLTLVVVLLTDERYFEQIQSYIRCVTVNSPILINDVTSHSNQTVYRENSIGNMSVCESILEVVISTLPSLYSVAGVVLLRCVWLVVFIVLIPSCSLKCFRCLKL